MRRALAIGLVVAAAPVLAAAGAGGGDGGAYRVRAIFDNAVSVIPGEDVKVAGARVGTVESLAVTPDLKAAVVLRIEDPGFRDFRRDASCTIRPQSLIGEKFVECAPTQPRAAGRAPPPPLPVIPAGKPGAGQRLLALDRTSTPVDLDLVLNVMRRPYAERLSLIVGELGAGLAGRGGDLRAAIRRANPALAQTDRVLRLLAEQSRALARLARDADAVLAPLARERRRVSGFVAGAAETARAVAERRADLALDVERLPAFLRELRPTMASLAGLAERATPVVADLRAAAPELGELVGELRPFAGAATPALESLGEAAAAGTPALEALEPVATRLREVATGARPVAANLAELAGSVKRTGGIERLMDFFYYQTLATNGFDALGHYMRAALVTNLCSTYAIEPAVGCSANFIPAGGAAVSGAAAARASASTPGQSASTPGPSAALDYLLGVDP